MTENNMYTNSDNFLGLDSLSNFNILYVIYLFATMSYEWVFYFPYLYFLRNMSQLHAEWSKTLLLM